jgi:hypothetical protein
LGFSIQLSLNNTSRSITTRYASSLRPQFRLGSTGEAFGSYHSLLVISLSCGSFRKHMMIYVGLTKGLWRTLGSMIVSWRKMGGKWRTGGHIDRNFRAQQ